MKVVVQLFNSNFIMIELLILIITSFNQSSFYIEFCDFKYNASYIYLDPSNKLLMGEVKNGTMKEIAYNINETCSYPKEMPQQPSPNSVTSEHQNGDLIAHNVTSDLMSTADPCNTLYYSFPPNSMRMVLMFFQAQLLFTFGLVRHNLFQSDSIIAISN